MTIGLRELGEDLLDSRVVGGNRAPLAQVARRAGQDEIVERVPAACGHRHDVVDVEHPAVLVEELEHTPLGDLGANGPQAAVLADAAIAFRHFVANPLGDVFGAITHAVSLAATPAVIPASDGRTA